MKYSLVIRIYQVAVSVCDCRCPTIVWCGLLECETRREIDVGNYATPQMLHFKNEQLRKPASRG